MKTPKSTRKAKQSAQKPVSKPQPNKPGNEIVETLHNLIEAAKAEGDDSTLVAVLMPATGLASRTKERDDRLRLLSPKEILKLRIVELVYGDEAMPESVLEAVEMILRHGVEMGEEAGEILARVLKKIFFPSEELKKIFSADKDEEDKAEPTVRRRRSRYGRQQSVKSRKSKAE